MTEQVTEEGWLRTGDLAYRDDDGFIFLVGRLSDAIKDVRGELLHPQEVEAAIEQSGRVTECAVCGVPDAAGEERLVAFVVTDSVVVDECKLFFELNQIVRESLGAHKAPARYVLVENLPRGANGKLLRKKLRELL